MPVKLAETEQVAVKVAISRMTRGVLRCGSAAFLLVDAAVL